MDALVRRVARLEKQNRFMKLCLCLMAVPLLAIATIGAVSYPAIRASGITVNKGGGNKVLISDDCLAITGPIARESEHAKGVGGDIITLFHRAYDDARVLRLRYTNGEAGIMLSVVGNEATIKIRDRSGRVIWSAP